ncbi:hypothetical protein QMK33_09955 [Hymenobacter sp. H14-R3]|uniref:DUF6702 family protein n=1 Tax=Hymenobacter sp. H14-R3 TaxID=3046308 RepID=UPI0024BA705E|nr:DUF6702 family protein [Hymenobacter sp. H14-R3]MDJ0365478.1 hypothetical protein [Hymenobacter sp. H14-R3]
MRRILLLSLVLLGLPGAAGTRHAYHTSILELKLNPQKQQVELALKVFTDDFSRALSQGQAKAVDLRSPGALPLAELYLHQHLKLSLPAAPRQPRRPLDVQFLGLQPEKDAYWLYAKVPLPRPTKELLIQQDMLLELFSDQMNIVNAEGNGKKISALLRSGHEEEVLNF